MKTNLTTKQIKKIQNGKLAIFKDIDTAEAREYLLKVLEMVFPKDKASEIAKKKSVIEYVYFCRYDEIRWTVWVSPSKTSIINLSQIMYTYNPEQFKPISMPCTEEQWNNDLKPVVEAFGLCTKEVNKWNECRIIKNNFNKQPNYIGTINWHELTQDHYSQTEFLEACGIVRADKGRERLPKIIITHNPKAGSWVLEAFKELHTITTDQIKTARTNPETLEELFPKVFEKPVVEVGRWYVFEGDSKRIVKFVEKENLSNYSGYGFNANNEFSSRNFCSKQVNFKITEVTLSDLQPLFEAEFNKRYKEGDLLGSPHSGAEFEYRAKDVEYDQLLSNVSYIGHFCIFKNGNFAKVIKSAKLIKAEQELEQAKKRVERLTNK